MIPEPFGVQSAFVFVVGESHETSAKQSMVKFEFDCCL